MFEHELAWRVQAPGLLDELGQSGFEAWDARVVQRFREVADKRGENRRVVSIPTSEMTVVTAPDWTGFPIRVSSCLGRQAAQRLLDWRRESGDRGRFELQEEYLEWRVVTGEGGRIQAGRADD